MSYNVTLHCFSLSYSCIHMYLWYMYIYSLVSVMYSVDLSLGCSTEIRLPHMYTYMYVCFFSSYNLHVPALYMYMSRTHKIVAVKVKRGVNTWYSTVQLTGNLILIHPTFGEYTRALD